MARDCPWDNSRLCPWDRAAADNDDPFGYENISPQEGGRCLFDYLTQLKHLDILKANHCCILAFWAKVAGACGIDELAKRPDAGHFSRTFDSAVGSNLNLEQFYVLDVVQENRLDASRQPRSLETFNLFDVLSEEVAALENITADLLKAITERKLPETYYTHPAVVNAPPGTLVHAYSLYFDGVAFTRTDSIVAFYCYNLLVGRRRLVCSLRKSELCKCGCGGWCSYFEIWRWIAWNNRALATGRRPTHRHDKLEVVNGSSVEMIRGACLFTKADMMEFVSSLGLPGVTSNNWGCPKCNCNADNMFHVPGWSPLDSPHRTTTHADYEQSCRDCEIDVTFRTTRELSLLRGSLGYDRKHARGRALLVDLVEFNLMTGDRVEITESMPYLSLLDKATPPVTVRFWRRSGETRVRRRNPLFDAEVGVTVDRCIVFDWLHTISLGPPQNMLAIVFSDLFEQDAWGTGNSHLPSRMQLSVIQMQAELFQWYGTEQVEGRIWSRVQTLPVSTFGTPGKPSFSFHGGETNGFVHFTLSYLLPKYGHKLRRRRKETFEQALAAIATIMRLIKAFPDKNPIS